MSIEDDLEALKPLVPANPEMDERFMDALAPNIRQETARHIMATGEGWVPADLITPEYVEAQGDVPPMEIDDDTLALFHLGTLIERGPTEYAMLARSTFTHPDFDNWFRRWVREEYFHGPAFQNIAMLRRLPGLPDMDRSLAGYLDNGLSWRFDDTAAGLAYPAIQEISTEMTHRAVMKRIPGSEKTFRAVMGKVIGDEHRHAILYTNMVRQALHSEDPEIATNMFNGFVRTLLTFKMPGFKDGDIPNVERYAGVYTRTGVFTPGLVVNDIMLPLIGPKKNGDPTAAQYGLDILGIPDSSLSDSAKSMRDLAVPYLEEIASQAA